MNIPLTLCWQRVPGLIDDVSDQYRQWLVVRWHPHYTSVLARGVVSRDWSTAFCGASKVDRS